MVIVRRPHEAQQVLSEMTFCILMVRSIEGILRTIMSRNLNIHSNYRSFEHALNLTKGLEFEHLEIFLPALKLLFTYSFEYFLLRLLSFIKSFDFKSL